jgi:arylformamidase
MFTYPGEPAPRVIALKRMRDGSRDNVSELCMSAHSGTHVDAPWHFISDGKTVEQLLLDQLCGPARLVEIKDREAVRVAELERHSWDGVNRVLFKTRNGELLDRRDFSPDFVYIDGDAAEWLVQKGIKLVGIDYLSADKFKLQPARAHLALLGAGVIILEGVDLRRVSPGDYELLCLPLKFANAEAAPARVILRDVEHLASNYAEL